MHPIPTLERLSVARTAIVTELRDLAAAIETAPMVQVGEALALLDPTLQELFRWADRVGLREPAASR